MLDAILKAARKAANYLSVSKRPSRIVGRGSFGDVTKAFDREAENIIIEVLEEEFGNDILVVSEEVGVYKPVERPRYLFIIDPVDGSTNYDAGIPWVSVSIGGTELKGGVVRIKDLEAAVVYDVFNKKAYSYSSDGGVKINGFKAHRRDPPANVLLGYFEVPEAYEALVNYLRLRGGRIALRSLGSASLDIIQVGLGVAEAFIDARAKLRNVDVAASLKIATALGARACACEGMQALNIRVDDLIKINCIGVGHDETHYRWVERVIRSKLNP